MCSLLSAFLLALPLPGFSLHLFPQEGSTGGSHILQHAVCDSAVGFLDHPLAIGGNKGGNPHSHTMQNSGKEGRFR